MDINLETLSTQDVQLGMFLAETDRPWLETPYLLQGFVLEDEKDLQWLQENCRFAKIDRKRSLGTHHREAKRESTANKPRPRMHRAMPFNNIVELRGQVLGWLKTGHTKTEIKRNVDVTVARAIAEIEPHYDSTQKMLRQFFVEKVNVRDLELNSIAKGVGNMVVSIEKNREALVWLSRLRRTDEYSFDHAFDVSVHLLLFGRHLGFPSEQLHTLGMAGLLQDIGKIQLDPELLNKRGMLTPAERRIMETHVQSSLELLSSKPEITPDILQIIARHHERIDGTGYMQGLRGKNIGLFSEMSGLVDTYCAMTMDKPYRNALDHNTSLEQLYAMRDTEFGSNLIEQFVQCIGLYPIGALVELNSGEIGVVIEQNRVQRTRPRILLLLTIDKNPVRLPPVIDLRQDTVGPEGVKYRIVRALPPNAFGLNSQDYYLE